MEFGNGRCGRNGVLREEGQGLTDGELIKSLRASDIFKNYRIKEQLVRNTAAVEFVSHTESYLKDQGYRGQFPTYVRPINRILRNWFHEQQCSNCGWLIRMIIHEGCRTSGITMAEIEALIPIEHFSGVSTKSLC